MELQTLLRGNGSFELQNVLLEADRFLFTLEVCSADVRTAREW